MKILIIGGTGIRSKATHPGGQVTLVKGLIAYIRSKKIKYRCIDTFVSNFPRPSTLKRLAMSLGFYGQTIFELLFQRPDGVIVFGDIGLSLYEKCIFFVFCRIFRVNCSFVICGGYNKIEADETFKKKIMRRSFKVVNNVVVQGFNFKKILKDSFGINSHVHVIHNWYGHIPPVNIVDKTIESITILFCGWLIPEKGIFELIEVARRIKETHQNVRFLFAGGGDSIDACNQIKVSEGLSNVQFLGWCDKKKLQELYGSADIFALPSHAEGFPLVINEAMSHGLPIVATNVGAISDSVIDGYNGYCAKLGDKDGLHQGIVKLVESRERREQFGANSLLMLKKNHDPEICGAKLIGLFENQTQENESCAG